MSDTKHDSHELAQLLERRAAELRKAPAFVVPDYMVSLLDNITYYYEKETFIEAVKALGSGRKDATDVQYFQFFAKCLPSFEGKLDEAVVESDIPF